jgi:radical SAM protein with 4Fe4S-binding SPASM domain
MKTQCAGLLDEPLLLSLELNKDTIDIKKSLLLKILNLIKKSNFLSSIILLGSEPLSSKYYQKLVEISKSKNIYLSVDVHNFKFKKNDDLSNLTQIRLHVPDITYRSKNLSHNINFLKKHFKGYKVLVYTINSKNYNKIIEFIEFTLNNNFLCNIFFQPRQINPSNCLTKKKFWQLIDLINQYKKKYGEKIIIDAPVASSKYNDLCGACPGFNISLHIDIEGNIKICSYQENHFLNIRNYFNLKDIWNEIKNIQQTIFSNSCRKCNRFIKCMGGCYLNLSKGRDYYCMRNSEK